MHSESPARFITGYPRARRIGGFGFDVELRATAPCEAVLALFPGSAYETPSASQTTSFYGMWLGLDGPSGGKNEENAVHADDAIEIAWSLGHSLRLDRAEPRASRYLDEAPVRAPLASSLDALYGITAQEYLPYSLYSRRLLHRPPRSMAAYAMRVSSFAALGEGAAAIGTSTVRLGAPLDAAQAAEEQAPMERREAEAVLRQAAYDAARGRLPRQPVGDLDLG